MGGGAGLGLAGGATLAGGKVIVAGSVGTLVLDAEAKLDGTMVKLNCGGEKGGVSAEDRDPKRLDTPRDVVMKKLHVRILDAQRLPMRNKKYMLTVEGTPYEGTTSATGDIDVEVPAHVEVGKLTVWKDDPRVGERLRWNVDIEPKLPNPSRPAGACARLSNLGYYVGPRVKVIDARLEDAIKRFQFDHGLLVDGKLGPQTAYVITTVHGH
jgi:hypothetical protein